MFAGLVPSAGGVRILSAGNRKMSIFLLQHGLLFFLPFDLQYPG